MAITSCLAVFSLNRSSFTTCSLLNTTLISTGGQSVSNVSTIDVMLATHSSIHSPNQSPAIVFPPRMTVPKHLDELTAQSFLNRCRAKIQAERQSWLILDFCETDFINSCGVEVLTQIGKLAWEHKFRIVAWSIHPQIENTLRVTGCDLFIQIDRRMQALLSESSENSHLSASHSSISSIPKRIVGLLETITNVVVRPADAV